LPHEDDDDDDAMGALLALYKAVTSTLIYLWLQQQQTHPHTTNHSRMKTRLRKKEPAGGLLLGSVNCSTVVTVKKGYPYH